MSALKAPCAVSKPSTGAAHARVGRMVPTLTAARSSALRQATAAAPAASPLLQAQRPRQPLGACRASVSYKEVMTDHAGPSIAVEVFSTEEAVGVRMCQVRGGVWVGGAVVRAPASSGWVPTDLVSGFHSHAATEDLPI